ncbi:MAG: hypothetical protein GXX84_19210 [Acidobacteria bacterium]|nr:hypothetical protein [Acidobacteriota bacterium]
MNRNLSALELSKADDLVVITLAVAKDRLAFEEVVKRFQSRVRGFMHRLCNRPDLADDLAQQAFLKAWNSISQLRNPKPHCPGIPGIGWAPSGNRGEVFEAEDCDTAGDIRHSQAAFQPSRDLFQGYAPESAACRRSASIRRCYCWMSRLPDWMSLPHSL